MILKCKTLKEWEDFGLLVELPEDRKEMMVSCYNIVMKWLMKDESHDEDVECIIFSVIYRIVKIVDLNELQVLETCMEFQNSWIKFDPTRYAGRLDAEAAFVKAFAEMKISQYQNKLF